jgi:hypothetical protein
MHTNNQLQIPRFVKLSWLLIESLVKSLGECRGELLPVPSSPVTKLKANLVGRVTAGRFVRPGSCLVGQSSRLKNGGHDDDYDSFVAHENKSERP